MPARNFLVVRLEMLIRKVMNYGFSGLLPLYIVNEYPRSGGTWIGQIVSAYLNLPFPRNQFPRFTPSIMHTHELYSPFLKNTCCILRDGRDVMVSYYNYRLFTNEYSNDRAVFWTRKILPFQDYDNVEKNLPIFMEYVFTHPFFSFHHFTWTEFVESWIDQDVSFVRYERMLRDPLSELGQALYTMLQEEPDKARLLQAIEAYSFENIAGRKAGTENRHSHLRKGVAGDWKKYFSREARQIFHHYAGKALLRLGYEFDDRWVNS